MLRFRLLGTLVLAIAIAMLLPNAAEAKRFKGYPEAGQDEPQTNEANQPNHRPAPSGQPSQAGPGGGQAPGEAGQSPDGEKTEEPGTEEDDKDEEGEEEDDSEEPNAGLLGTVLHGRDGIKVEYLYTGDIFTNMRGGIDTNDATRYMGVFDMVLTADLDQLHFFPGGTFFVYGQQIHGQGLTDRYVGDVQFLDNIDAPDRTQISEYWWQRKFFDDQLTVRLGKQDCNAEFAVLEVAGDFINSSYGVQPTIPMPTYPDPSMAAVAILGLNDWLTFQTGVWDGRPDGRNWGFSDSGKTFTIAELKATWSMLDGRLPGDAQVGGWYHSDDFDEVGGVRRLAGNRGYYLGVEQMVWKESWDKDDDQGLGLFVHYGWAPRDRSEIADYLGGGLVYKGLIPCRNDDTTGLAANTVFFSERLTERDNETGVELFHKVQVTKYIDVQPDLQYIARPGGLQRDAFVGGVRVELVL